MKSYTTSVKLLPSTLAAFALYSATVSAQEPTSPPTPPAAEAPILGSNDPVELPPAPAVKDEAPAPPAPSATLPGEEVAEAAPEAQEELADGMRLNDAQLNTVFEVLARDAGLSYFHNNRIAGDEFKVNGYLRDGDALTQMEDLAFSHALKLHRRGNTIYALTSDQLNQLPATEWDYQLRYLRSANMKEHIRELVSPLLSPNTGIVNYEEKTNTLIVIDTPHKIERVKSLLERIDRAKGQIVVEVKIYRVNTSVGQSLGLDWAKSLGTGEDRTETQAVAGLNNLLGLPTSTVAPLAAGDLVFAPDSISAVLTALNDGGITKLQNNPVIITEDNEPASIAIIQRVPILTSETTASTGAAEPTVTEEVRYKIDEEDSTDPETTREIGTTIYVTPTLLPDGTIRLAMRPREASITRRVTGQSGNTYPEVQESTLTTIARIPDGHSLIVGGFFREEEVESENKVPLLGDIPVINFFFKSKSTTKEQSNLLFVVTPSSYNPESHAAHHRTHNRVNNNLRVQGRETAFDDPRNAEIFKPNLPNTLKNIKKDVSSQGRSNKRYRVRR